MRRDSIQTASAQLSKRIVSSSMALMLGATALGGACVANLASVPSATGVAYAAETEGWHKTNNKQQYIYSDGSKASSGWAEIDGAWYLFDKNGFMLTGWQTADGNKYYLGEDGKMCTGWVKVKDEYYYLNDSGVLKTGWLNDGGTWYYLEKDSGVMVKNSWREDCFLQDDGVMATEMAVGPYYVGSNGKRSTQIPEESIFTQEDFAALDAVSESVGITYQDTDTSRVFFATREKEESLTSSTTEPYLLVAIAIDKDLDSFLKYATDSKEASADLSKTEKMVLDTAKECKKKAEACKSKLPVKVELITSDRYAVMSATDGKIEISYKDCIKDNDAESVYEEIEQAQNIMVATADAYKEIVEAEETAAEIEWRNQPVDEARASEVRSIISQWEFFSSMKGITITFQPATDGTYTITSMGVQSFGTYEVLAGYLKCVNGETGAVGYVPLDWKDNGNPSLDLHEGFMLHEKQPA